MSRLQNPRNALVLLGIVGGFAAVSALLSGAHAQAQSRKVQTEISVIIASYGANCSLGAVNNLTTIVKNACDTKPTCGYAVTTAPGGDPCNLVPKEFDVSWMCTWPANR